MKDTDTNRETFINPEYTDKYLELFYDNAVNWQNLEPKQKERFLRRAYLDIKAKNYSVNISEFDTFDKSVQECFKHAQSEQAFYIFQHDVLREMRLRGEKSRSVGTENIEVKGSFSRYRLCQVAKDILSPYLNHITILRG
jgi:hypothetical protein